LVSIDGGRTVTVESGNGELTVKWNGHQFELGMRSLAIKKAKKSEKNITITTASGFEPSPIRWLCVAGSQTSCRCDFRSSHIESYLCWPYIYESTAADQASKKNGFTAASCDVSRQVDGVCHI
jgi:hypothetical protein